MTRTEERLADALGASAGRVHDDRLRPLPEPKPGLNAEPGPGTGTRPVRAAWRGWLVPLAAAASVALVIGVALALASVPGRLAGPPPASRGGPAAAGLPRYFVQVAAANPLGPTTVEIRSVATGKVVASAPSPRPAGWSVYPTSTAAAPGGRTFYVAYNALRAGSPGQTWIYRFSITSSALTMAKGGLIPRSGASGIRGSMAVSPDGTRLALTVGRPAGRSNGGPRDAIAVIDLRTGAQATWQGGLDRSGRALQIPDVSWTPDGQSVVFLALWCDPAIDLGLCAEGIAPSAIRGQQVRSLPVSSRAGPLARGSVLLAAGTVPVIAHAVAGPRPGELTLVVLSGRSATAGAWQVATVERVAARTGSVLGVGYRLATRRPSQLIRDIMLGVTPGGQHLLLSYAGQDGFRTGWIGQGKFHPLPVPQPYRVVPITAW